MHFFSGQHVTSDVPIGDDTVDCEAMMAKCRDIEVSNDETIFAMQHKEDCARFGMENGRITEEFLNDMNIYNTEGTTERDGLVECRQHAFLVTHIESEARHKASRQGRELSRIAVEERADPVNKQRRADARLILSAQVAAEKVASKELERVRFSGLSATEKAEEKAAKLIVTTAKKQASATIKAAKEANLAAALIRANTDVALLGVDNILVGNIHDDMPIIDSTI